MGHVDFDNAKLVASLSNHAEDFVRLLRAAESLLRDCGSEFETTPPCSGCFANMAAALAPFEEANRD